MNTLLTQQNHSQPLELSEWCFVTVRFHTLMETLATSRDRVRAVVQQNTCRKAVAQKWFKTSTLLLTTLPSEYPQPSLRKRSQRRIFSLEGRSGADKNRQSWGTNTDTSYILNPQSNPPLNVSPPSDDVVWWRGLLSGGGEGCFFTLLLTHPLRSGLPSTSLFVLVKSVKNRRHIFRRTLNTVCWLWQKYRSIGERTSSAEVAKGNRYSYDPWPAFLFN